MRITTCTEMTLLAECEKHSKVRTLAPAKCGGFCLPKNGEQNKKVEFLPDAGSPTNFLDGLDNVSRV